VTFSSKYLAKIDILSEILEKSKCWPKIDIFVKIRNFEELNCWSKIESLANNRNFCQRFYFRPTVRFSSKILIKNRYLDEKLKYLPQINKIFAKNRNVGKKS